MSDLNKEALDIWGGLKPMIDQEISSRTQGMVQRRKAKVTTAPSLATNTIGVTEAFGDEMFLPFVSNMISAKVGDFVWIEWMYGATNAFVSSFAAVDDKNLTVAGTLDVVPRRCYATLSSAGWYRVLRFDATNSFDVLGADGAIIDFYIIRQYNNLDNDVHKITLLRTYNKNVFVGEESLTNTFGISRIRLTLHDGGDDDRQAFVDIYNETSSENPVSVYFNVYTHRSYADKWNAVNFTSVGPSPYGETVVTEYEFVANTDSMIAFTPTAGSNYAGYGNCWYSRNGRTVHLHVGLSGLTANTPQNVFTMPEGFRPITIAAANGAGGSTYTAISRLAVSTDGTVQIISDDQYACVDITYLADV